MVQDINMRVGLIPDVDERALRKSIQKIGESVRNAKPMAGHSKLSSSVAQTIMGLMSTGRFPTTASASRYMRQLSGGGFSQQGMAIFTSGEAMARQFFSTQKNITQKYANVRQAYSNFSKLADSGKTEQASGLLGQIIGLRREVAMFYTMYRTAGLKIPLQLAKISQDTSVMRKEVSDFDIVDENKRTESVAGGGTEKEFFKKVLSFLTSFLGIKQLLQKGWQGFKASVDRGMQALRLEAAYGRDVNWGDVRARAGLFNMPIESAMAANKYASDFTQRMQWGELSEREIIGLSRAGRWGRMVMSGEAATNPEAANAAFEDLVASTDPAKMRSILRQIGLPEDVMNYRLQPYDEETRKGYTDKWKELASLELDIAKATYDAGNQLQQALEEASDAVGAFAAQTFKAVSPQARATYERLKERFPGEGVGTKGYTSDYVRSLGVGLVSSAIGVPSPALKAIGEVTQNVTNNFTINGNVDEDSKDSILEQMSAQASKNSYDNFARQIGAKTGF